MSVCSKDQGQERPCFGGLWWWLCGVCGGRVVALKFVSQPEYKKIYGGGTEILVYSTNGIRKVGAYG